MYWPDCEGACTVRVRAVVPGAIFPMAIVLLLVETWLLAPPFTDSVQLRKVNLAKSPAESMVALLNVTPP